MNRNRNRYFGSPLKAASTLCIAGAVGLELGNLCAKFILGHPLQGFDTIFYISRFALIAHAIEGAIAAIYSPSKQQSPLGYAIYTFFVGAPGLAELFGKQSE